MALASQSATVARLESSIRRNIPSHVWKDILRKPRQLRGLVVPFKGSKKLKHKPCLEDIVANKDLLRGVLEVFPSKIPGAHLIAESLSMIDSYHNGDVMRHPDPADKQSCNDALLTIAYSIKVLVQRLRRLFRRSSRSRFHLG
jgi:hypothetical protein